jgi:integrase
MARTARPWKRKSGGPWMAWIQGRQVRLAAEDATKAEAQKALHRLLAEAGQPTASKPPSIGCRQLCALFLDHAKAELSEGTYYNYGVSLTSFANQFGHLDMADLKPLHVQQWLNKNPQWNGSTKRLRVATVKRACTWAVELGYLEASPIAKVKAPTPSRRTAIMTEAQTRAAIEHYAPGDPFRPFLECLFATGCRPGEMAALTAADLNLDAGIAVLHAHKTGKKIGRPRVIYLTAHAVEILKALASRRPSGPLFLNERGEPWSKNACVCSFRRLRKALGYGPEGTAYSLRHGFATGALERGVPIATVAELLGHTNTSMVSMHYGHLGDRREYLLGEAERAIGQKPPKTEEG